MRERMPERMALTKAAEILAHKGYCILSADSVCDKEFDVPGVCAKCIRNALRRDARKELRSEIRMAKGAKTNE